MKLMKIASALFAGLLLAGCTSTSADSSPAPSGSTEVAQAEPSVTPIQHITAEIVIADLKGSGECTASFEIEAPTPGSDDGFGCIHIENGRNFSIVVSQVESRDDATAFAEAAFLKGASLRIDAGTINHFPWSYGYESGLIISGPEEIIDHYLTGNVGMVYTDEDIIHPVLSPLLDELRTATRAWHDRCADFSGSALNPFDEPEWGDLYDQCYTGGRLTEINTVAGWWQMLPYLEMQKDLPQAPDSGPFYALVNENWAVVDNEADKRSFEKLKAELGGEVIDLMKFNAENFEMAPEKLT